MGITSLAMIGSISVMADGLLKACTATLRNVDHFVDCDNHGKYQHRAYGFSILVGKVAGFIWH
jgi:hypothetical protein